MRFAIDSVSRLTRAVLAVLVAASGCARGPRPEDVQAKLLTQMISETRLPIASLTCATSAESQAGQPLECTGKTKAGASFTVKATPPRDPGAKLRWEFVQTNGLLSIKKIEGNVARDVKDRMGVDARVICGPPEDREVEPGKTFECRATAPQGQAATVTITMVDMSGQVRWDLVPDPPRESDDKSRKKKTR
jgi:hypothetical protein